MIVRAITGVIFIGVIIGSLLWSPHAVSVVFLGFMILGICEFYGILNKHEKVDVSPGLGMSLAAVISTIALLAFYDVIREGLFLQTLLPIIFIGLVSEIWRKKGEPILNSAVLVLGLIYVVLPFLLLIGMHYNFESLGNSKVPLVLGMFFLIWTNDTFAYLTGKAFGKTKLIERVSPNKTWEGTVGGIVLTILVGGILGYFTDALVFWIVAAAIISPSAIIGDLFESVLKRNLGIKDSGSILPGHGGILDRFDATLMAVPFFFLWFSV
ncbi:MAG: phosphatidate cytidylyltransferase, partial [Crocinitomicaceae bacterium]